MSLDDDIRQAIESNLTAELGTRLKERLDKADADADAVDRMRDTMARMDEDLAQHKEHARSEEDLKNREVQITDRERQFDLREAVLDVQEKYATAARDDMMKVMETVFKGPGSRLAFDLAGNLSGLINASGMSHSPYANLSGKVETDGDSG
jgi:hypothetical protein